MTFLRLFNSPLIIIFHNLTLILFIYIILDEISMVSDARLAQMHLRLEEIFGQSSNSDTTFAGINLLFLGDLLQVIIITQVFSNLLLIRNYQYSK